MAIVRWFGCLLLLASCASAQARPEFWEIFVEKYNPSPESTLAKAVCLACHVVRGQAERNEFGKQVEKALDDASTDQLTAAMLASVESQDADRDGATNLAEITRGSPPHTPQTQPPTGPAIPKHSFHPLIVHFPIALFIFGAILDYWGFRKKRQEAREGAALALWVGALTSLLALSTGLAAFLRLGFDLSGTMLAHLLTAITASLLMLTVAAVRRKVPHESAAYWLSLAAATVAIAAAGHLGATLVYG